MTDQSKFLKTILTTASTLAIAMGGTSNAFASAQAAHNINGDINVSTITPGNWANFNNINSTLTFMLSVSL